MLKKICVYIPSVAVPILVNILLVFLYAQYLEPADYGMLNIYLNTINILYAALLSFIQSAAFRFYSVKGAYSSRKQYLSTYVLTEIALTIILLVIAFCVNCFIFSFNYVVIVASVLFNGLYQFYINLYRLENHNAKYVACRIGAAVITLLSVIIVANIFKPVNYFTIIWIIYGSYAIFALWAMITQKEIFSAHEISGELIKKSLTFGLPMMGVTLLGNVISSSDQYLLKYYLGDIEVGLYSLGHKLSDMSIANITMLLLVVATPVIMKEYDQESNRRGIDHLTKVLSLNILLVVLIGVEIVCFASPVIEVLFPKYQGAEQVIRLVAIAAIFHSFSLVTCKPFELTKNTQKLLGLLVITAVINLLYNIVCIPLYGINAAAHSSIIAYVVYDFLLYFMIDKNKRVQYPGKDILKILLSALAAIICGVVLNGVWKISTLFTLIIQCSIVGLVFCLMSWILGTYKVLREI